jgi:hypothetical protein
MSNRDQRLKAEIESHLRMAIRDRMDRGESAAEAEANARREMGNEGLIQEVTRDMWSWNWLSSVVSDGRYALRQLSKNPGFTAIAILTLALGIGVTTAIFSVVYGVLLRSLPYPDASRIMAIFEVNSKGNPARLADPNFDDFRDQNRSFQAIAKYSSYTVSVSGASQPTRTMAATVSSDFLKVLGMEPVLGRDFSAADAKKGRTYRARRLRLLAPVSRLAARSFGVAFADRSESLLRDRRASGRISFSRGCRCVAASRFSGREPASDFAQLPSDRPPARRRDRGTSKPRHQYDRAAHS